MKDFKESGIGLGKVVAKVWQKDGEFVAKKDFEIHHNDYHREIKKGEDVSDVPSIYHQNLKTEQVI